MDMGSVYVYAIIGLAAVGIGVFLRYIVYTVLVKNGRWLPERGQTGGQHFKHCGGRHCSYAYSGECSIICASVSCALAVLSLAVVSQLILKLSDKEPGKEVKQGSRQQGNLRISASWQLEQSRLWLSVWVVRANVPSLT